MGEQGTITPPTKPLTFDGFALRLPTDDDIEALVRFGDDPDTAGTLWVPIPTPCSKAEAQERLQEFIDGWSGRSTFGPTFVVANAASGEFVGVVFLRARDNATVEIAYGTAPQHRGLGIATRMLLRASRWCFEELRAARVELLIYQGNDASCRVAEKAGFEFRGVRRTTAPASGEQYDDLLYVLEPPTPEFPTLRHPQLLQKPSRERSAAAGGDG
jgi:RimJ/RimL family protein N-acetyltransferase